MVWLLQDRNQLVNIYLIGETKIESVEEEIINAELVQHTSQDVIEKDDILQQAVTSAIKVAADSIVYTTEGD